MAPPSDLPTSNMSIEDGRDRLQPLKQRMATIESVCERLLAERHVADLLYQKILQLESYVADFCPGSGEPDEQRLAQEWRLKVANLWVRYSTASKTSNSSSGAASSSFFRARSIENIPKPQQQQARLKPILKKKTNSGYYSPAQDFGTAVVASGFTAKPAPSPPKILEASSSSTSKQPKEPQNPESQNGVGVKRAISLSEPLIGTQYYDSDGVQFKRATSNDYWIKCDTKVQSEAKEDSGPEATRADQQSPQSDEDHDNDLMMSSIAAIPGLTTLDDPGATVTLLKALIKHLVQVRERIDALPGFDAKKRLNDSVFELAFGKLPPGIRDQFQNSKTVFYLIGFLHRHFNRSFNDLRERLKSAQQNIQQSLRKFCGFCKKSTDHTVQACPLLKAALCFVCHQEGHISRYCARARFMASFERTDE